MADLAFVGAGLGFFALCALYVRACERIVAPGDEAGGVDR